MSLLNVLTKGRGLGRADLRDLAAGRFASEYLRCLIRATLGVARGGARVVVVRRGVQRGDDVKSARLL
jgi:hypothetical protein